MLSIARATGNVELPLVEGHYSMIPFDLKTMKGLEKVENGSFVGIVRKMIEGIKGEGTAFFTFHGKKLQKGGTLRRGGPHTDGSYDQSVFAWGGGWKVGETGPYIDSQDHKRLYESDTGGIILSSNFESCVGWIGEYDGLPKRGGDCSHIKLDAGFMLKRNKVYYGNNHFIHESVPVSDDVHRVFARITLPQDHVYQ